jgi:ferrous iron transport protein B
MTASLPIATIPSVQRTRRVALIGNPNTGKSTLFNALTGFRQRVGNYPGVTVERRVGRLKNSQSTRIEIVDLPGTYSLAVHQEDEAIVLDVLLGRQSTEPAPDVIVSVIDASNLRRNLFLTTQVLELDQPVIVALNMVDVAEARGIHVNVTALEEELGVPVVPVVAKKNQGVETLGEAIASSAGLACSKHCHSFPDCVCAELDGLCTSIGGHCDNGGRAARAEAMQTLLAPGGYHESRMVQRCGLGMAEELAERRKRIAAAGESVIEVEARVRYAWIDRVLSRVVSHSPASQRTKSELADRFLTHPVTGLVVLMVLLGACFQSVYAWAQPVMDAIDGSFGALGSAIGAAVPDGAIQSLLVNGVIAGVGAVLVFLPQILILFLFLAILEDCGYMARAAFLLDRWMGFLGLNGKAFIPLLSSFACAVPGIMATRTIESRRDRMVTILIAPLMSCSARLPVYVLLIGAFVPAVPLLGGLVNLQAATLLAMYLVGALVAIPIALLLKRTILKGKAQAFLLELPTYKWPSVRTVFHRVFEQGKEFCVSAGTIIFAVAIVVWALGYYPRPAAVAVSHDGLRAGVADEYNAAVAEISKKYTQGTESTGIPDNPNVASLLAELEAIAADAEDATLPDSVRADFGTRHGEWGRAALAVYEAGATRDTKMHQIDRDEAGTYLRQSILGRMGLFIEPVVEPLGWDWRIGTAVIAAFPAREVVVATMGTIYNLGDEQDENSAGLRDKLHAATWPNGQPVFNLAVALSIMVFFALCCQCGATLATIKRETRSWRWPLLSFVYMTGLAYVAAFAVYQVAVRLI